MAAKIKKWFTKDNLPIWLAAVSALSLVASFFNWFSLGSIDIAWVAIILCGIPILKGAIVGLITSFDIKADVLVSLALIGAAYIGEIFAAGEVAVIMAIGAILEDMTTKKAQQGIEKLMDLTPLTARLMVDQQEQQIAVAEVKTDDILRVLPGETIAVDGMILLGQTSIDQSVMTGESIPVDKGPGDEVFSGTVNQFGSFDMRAVRVGEDSSLQRMIRYVAEADASKSPIVRLTDRWATWIVVIALTAAILTYLLTGQLIRAVTILVVFCPCALILATPTAIMAAIGNATKYGILIRSGDTLERLAQVNSVAFDKTGTLTYGKPQVEQVIANSDLFTETELLGWALAAEQRSEHPLGKAIIEFGKLQRINFPEAADFLMLPGKGVSATINQKQVLVGNLAMMQENGIAAVAEISRQMLEQQRKGATIMLVAVGGQLAGLISLSDVVRSDARVMIEEIHSQNMSTILLTGDHQGVAEKVVAETQVEQLMAELKPEGKVAAIKEIQAQAERKLCMVGDGINDAPALKTAFVGLAMGGIGSDITVEAADAVLVSDDIKRIPYLFKLAKQTTKTIRINIVISLTLNFVAIILAATGLMGPVVGALVHNVGSVAVILHSIRLLYFKDSLGPISIDHSDKEAVLIN